MARLSQTHPPRTYIAMNKKLGYLAGVMASAAALLVATTLPASAAAGDTTTTFSLAGGALSVSVQANAALTNGNTGSASVSGQLGVVQVTDARGGTATWSAFATSTTFTDGAGSVSTGVSYNAGAITTTGTVVMPPATATALNGTAAKVAGPIAVVGNNTASWNPTLTVSLPTNALVGDYTGVVHTSVS
jgi:hypothetical protein